VIASITGADLVLVVTEPTISGQHDLDRVIELTEHFGITTTVCVNKYDINLAITEEIEKKAQLKGFKVAGKIAYDTAVTKAQLAARSIIEYSESDLKAQIVSLWESVLDTLS